MSENSPYFMKFEDTGSYADENPGYSYGTIDGQAGAIVIFPLENSLGREYVPDPRAFNIDSPFLLAQSKFSLNENASFILVVSSIDSVFSPMDISLYVQNPMLTYSAIYVLACAMYELHQKGIAFGELSANSCGMDAAGTFTTFGYGINNRDGRNKESIENDKENFSKFVGEYFPDFINKKVTIEQVITSDIVLNETYFSYLEEIRIKAKGRFKKLHFKRLNLVTVSVKDAYPFLPVDYQSMPKSHADGMIKGLQMLYGGTPEEAFRMKKNEIIINELQNRPPQDPDPERPYDLFYRKIMLNRSPMGNTKAYQICSGQDFEGNLISCNLNIRFNESPPNYVPNEAIFNIDFEPLNNFLGYYTFDGSFCLISQYSKFQNIVAISVFEPRIRDEPIFSSILIIGMAASVFLLHKRGLTADGISFDKIGVDDNSLHPLLVEYGNPELSGNKTMEDDEEDLLKLCKELYPKSFEKVKTPIAKKIFYGEIKLYDSPDVESYRTHLINEFEIESTGYKLDLSRLNIEEDRNEDELFKPLEDLESIPENIPKNLIKNFMLKKYNIPYLNKNLFTENDPIMILNEADQFDEALMFARHSKKPIMYYYENPSYASQCEGCFIGSKYGHTNDHLSKDLLYFSGVNNSRSIDEYYNIYNKKAGKIPISVAFQLLVDFSPHMSPPESTFSFNTKNLISYAKKGDCGALHRLGTLLNNEDLIRKAAEWKYPPALYDVGRMDKNIEYIQFAAAHDYPLAKAFLEYNDFEITDEELVNKFINEHPENETAAEIYLYGIHTKRNKDKGVEILTKNNHYFKLGMYNLFYDEINFKEAYEAFKSGSQVDQRCKFGQIIIDVYINEIYYEDYAESMEELANSGLMQARFFVGNRKEAADAGLRTAMFEYGRDIYLGENGQKMCVAKGYPYIMAAHRLGHPYAYQLLEISGRDPELIEVDRDLNDYDDEKLLQFSKYMKDGKYMERDYENSFNCIEIAANRGNEKALYLKAYYTQYGIGVSKNIDKALQIYEQIDTEDSLCQQGIIYTNKSDIKTGYGKLVDAINKGSMRAAFLLGILKRDPKGDQLLEFTARNGIVDAAFLLKYMTATDNDDEDLFEYTLELTKNGYGIANITLLNFISFNNILSALDSYSEVNFIEKAAYWKNYLNFNTIFQGLGAVFPGFFEADIFEIPESLNIQSITKLNTLPITKLNMQCRRFNMQYRQLSMQCRQHYIAMATFGNPYCMAFKAIRIYEYAIGIFPCKQALKLFKKAAENGSMVANFNLSFFYFRGIIVQQNRKLALHYGNIACKSGYAVTAEFLEYVADESNKLPPPFKLSNHIYYYYLAKTLFISDNKHLNQHDENSDRSLSSSTSNENEELENIGDNMPFTKKALELKAQDIRNSDAIFEYGSALYYGDYGYEKDRDKAKEQFLRIVSNPNANFMLRTKYFVPIKPIFRKKMTKKEEEFLGINSLDQNIDDDGCCKCCTCCSCCKKDDYEDMYYDEDDNEGGVVAKTIDFGMLIKSIWPIISVVISIIKIFQGASLATENEDVEYDEGINKIVNWSVRLITKIVDWTQVKNITPVQTGMMMSFLVLFLFTFPLLALKKSVPIFLFCLLSTLVFAPLCIGIAKREWIVFGVFLGYYLIIWPLVRWISKLIINNKLLNALMIIFYIPETIVGFALTNFYILIYKPNNGIIQHIMPYMKYFPDIDKIEDFFSNEYRYYDYYKNIKGDSTLNACFSWFFCWVFFNLIDYWILGLCPVFYFLLGLTIIIFIISISILIKGTYFVKFTMQILSYFAIFIYEKILELLLMPAVDLVTSDEGALLSNISKANVIIISIIMPFLFISLISLSVYNQSRAYHPAMYYGFISSTISVNGVCDGLKMRYSYWPIIDNLYQIIYAVLAVFVTPIVPSLFALIYFIVIWVLRPNLLGTDNIIQSGEPFALFIFNLIVFINKSSKVPLWAGILLIVLAFIPAIVCVVWYYAKQKGHDFELSVADMQYELDKRKKELNDDEKIPLIDTNKTWTMFKDDAIKEGRNFLFMKHFTLVEPKNIDEDDFPSPSFIQKILDIRGAKFIDILCSYAFTLGAFLFYLQIGERVNIHSS